MNPRARRRFWVEVGLGVNSTLLLLLILVTREWIELLFGVDPDGGSGAQRMADRRVPGSHDSAVRRSARRERRRLTRTRTASQMQTEEGNRLIGAAG